MYTKEQAIAKAKLNNKDCKIAHAQIGRWYDSNDYALYQVYGNYSHAKEQAMQYCEEMMHAYNGHGLSIISHNSMVFTVGFEFYDDETGALMFAYITKDYDRFCYQ